LHECVSVSNAIANGCEVGGRRLHTIGVCFHVGPDQFGIDKSVVRQVNSRGSIKAPKGFIYARLILALESGHEFAVKDLYKLDLDDFDLAIELMRDWRIDRFYIGKAKAFDSATHAANLS
jgi:hypothetical protein